MIDRTQKPVHPGGPTRALDMNLGHKNRCHLEASVEVLNPTEAHRADIFHKPKPWVINEDKFNVALEFYNVKEQHRTIAFETEAALIQ